MNWCVCEKGEREGECERECDCEKRDESGRLMEHSTIYNVYSKGGKKKSAGFFSCCFFFTKEVRCLSGLNKPVHRCCAFLCFATQHQT